jgi:hypothetical protein
MFNDSIILWKYKNYNVDIAYLALHNTRMKPIERKAKILMKKIKTKKLRPILNIIRTLMDVQLNRITYADKRQIPGINHMEAGDIKYPRASTITCIAESLGIRPDILLYSFGHLPDKEREIVSSDPFFYREKILELCNNHESRYQEQVDLDFLNIKRAADYIENNRCEPRKRVKRRTEVETDE